MLLDDDTCACVLNVVYHHGTQSEGQKVDNETDDETTFVSFFFLFLLRSDCVTTPLFFAKDKKKFRLW